MSTKSLTKLVKDEEEEEKERGSYQERRREKWRIYLVEKKDKEVSHCWKNVSILTYLIVIVAGIFCAKSWGDVVFMFGYRCIWNATLTTEVRDNATRLITFDNFDVIRWGDMSDCDFCQFLPVASMASGGFLATFFAMCGRGGDTTRNLPQPWRMVPVAFFFNMIFVIISSVHVAYVYQGFELFCHNIHPVNEKSIPKSCEDLFKGTVENSKDNLAANLAGAQIFAVISLLGWILGLLVLIIRCVTHADFHVRAERLTPVTPPRRHSNQAGEAFSPSTSTEYATPLTSINFG